MRDPEMLSPIHILNIAAWDVATDRPVRVCQTHNSMMQAYQSTTPTACTHIHMPIYICVCLHMLYTHARTHNHHVQLASVVPALKAAGRRKNSQKRRVVDRRVVDKAVGPGRPAHRHTRIAQSPGFARPSMILSRKISRQTSRHELPAADCSCFAQLRRLKILAQVRG